MGELLRRLRMLVGSRRWRRELEEEMQLHRELRGDEKRFGNELRLRERSRAQWGWTWLETWGQDMRHGLRLLGRTPLITALALVSLGLGIGATTALFSLTDAVLLRPLPIAHPNQLVQLTNNVFTSGSNFWAEFSDPLWRRIEQAGAFAGTLAVSQRGDPMLVSGSYFQVLGIHAQAGRLFSQTDLGHGCPAAVDISNSYWHQRFNASPSTIGSTVRFRNTVFRIIGVTPPSFFGTEVGRSFHAIAPLCNENGLAGQNSLLGKRNGPFLEVFARLQPGQTIAQAQARLNATRVGLLPALPLGSSARERAAFRIQIQPAAQGSSLLRGQQGLPLEVLLGVAGLVWLLACANLAALMLARATARRPELAIRSALGAGRARLVRQMLTESLLLAATGSLLGWALAAWACQAAVHFWSFPQNPLVLNLRPDARVLTFVTALTALTALLTGLYPALRASSREAAGTASHNPPEAAIGWRFIAGQLALALVLLASAGLFARTLVQLTGPGKGFDTSHVLLVRFPFPTEAGRESPSGQAQRAALLGRLRALPGVAAAGASEIVPTGGSSWNPVVWRIQPAGAKLGTYSNAITPGYFAALHTPLVAGRRFTGQDQHQPVVVINQSLAIKLFPNQNPVGQYLGSSTSFDNPNARVRIVGVVADAKYLSLRAAAPPTIYFPMRPRVFPGASFELRAAGSLNPLQAAVQRALGPGAKARLVPFTQFMDARLKPERMLAWLAGLFGILAVVLAGLGLYGITAYNAVRRRREFGIRVALGATSRAISRQVLREAGIALAAGLAIGGGFAWLLADALQAELGKLLYEVKARDVATWIGAVALLCAIAIVASFIPARRAARADAMAALREE